MRLILRRNKLWWTVSIRHEDVLENFLWTLCGPKSPEENLASRNRYYTSTNILAYFQAKWRLYVYYPSNIIRSVRNETYVISLLSKTDVDFYSNFITTTLFSSLETAPTLSPNLIPPLEEDCDRIGRKVWQLEKYHRILPRFLVKRFKPIAHERKYLMDNKRIDHDYNDDELNQWLDESLICSPTDWLFKMTHFVSVWPINVCLVKGLWLAAANRMVTWVTSKLTGCFADWLTMWPTDWVIYLPTNWLTVWRTD